MPAPGVFQLDAGGFLFGEVDASMVGLPYRGMIMKA